MRYRNDFPLAAKIAAWQDAAWIKLKAGSGRLTEAIRLRKVSLPRELLPIETKIAAILNGDTGVGIEDTRNPNPLRAAAAKSAIEDQIGTTLAPMMG